MHIDPIRPLDLSDADPAETREWREAFEAAVRAAGPERGLFLLEQLADEARNLDLVSETLPFSAYRNTIPLEQQPPFPGDLALEERLLAILRWNALAMVVRANKAYGELGGHIASYASVAEIFETGANHFFRGPDAPGGGDLVYYQPHSAPGVYARAYLEGRLSAEDLGYYRRELAGPKNGARGLSSYPHPWLMPDFWQVPTGSMGLGPISAVYQARFMRYLRDRDLADTDQRHVWGVFGDGEMDEPESIAGLTLAARENLDNLTFIINCNLQRLDGPVRGNGQIIQELEKLFRGAGWHVIKVLWGSDWDTLFARDGEHALLRRFAATVDGKYQTLGAKDGAYNLKNFFGEDPEVAALVAHMSDGEVDSLKRGGHDLRKLYAAFAAARAHKGQPTVILAKTKKGFGMGGAGESRMTAHQAKKLDIDALRAFRDRFHLPLSDDALERLEFYRPPEDSAELRYLRERRRSLGGSLPMRRPQAESLKAPPLESWGGFALAADGKEMSTTMGFVRMLGALLRDRELGSRIVPIVADEARTFGMTSLFRQVGIYSPLGQLYEPEDAGSMLSYREAADGQLLEEGITEAGALASWTAAATAYSVHGKPMLPFYIYYSMFGFQRVGDLIWAAADQRARGFLIGATAGRTTLSGEGLQHQDGASQLMASTVPNCRAYDPATAGELAVIVAHGMQRMLAEQRDEFYYITVGNENLPQPSLPAHVHDDVVRGGYRFAFVDPASAAAAGSAGSSVRGDSGKGSGDGGLAGLTSDGSRAGTGPHDAQPMAQVRLLGAGAMLGEARAAADLLAEHWHVRVEVISVTSFSELARDAAQAERTRRHAAAGAYAGSHLARLLPGDAPVIAASDYVRAVPLQIASYVGARFTALGTDGFGRSDRRLALRRFFEVDRFEIALAALRALVDAGELDEPVMAQAIERFGLEPDPTPPWER
ncbi:MAG: pyruvate dehydrogenase (acetyl-transferring), homodimeric type [Burkholderiaceae bacterium]